MPVPFTDEEYRSFQEWLTRGYGLSYGPEKRDILRARLEPRRAQLGLDSFEQLLFHLKFHPARAAEQEQVLSALTNNESYFFREPRQLELFRAEVLPELIARAERERGPLRLLSVGCAAGEEPYTLAILLLEAGVAPERVRITGLDIDAAALERARGGRYRPHALRALDAARRDRYFRREQDLWALDDRVRGMVDFRPANLMEDTWLRTLPPQHASFCRNVLIYFGGPAQQRAAEHLHRALAPGGFLFLGHAESLSRLPTPFQVERRPGAMYYRKEVGR